MTHFEFEAIGTGWKIDIREELSSKEGALLLEKIMNRIGEFDKNYSRFRSDSLVTHMSKVPGEYKLPEDADKMLSLYKEMYDLTNGLVTPLIGQVLVDTGYDADYSLLPKTPSKPLSWEEVLEWKNPTLTLKQAALLDFGAGGKGYLVDIIGELLENEKITSYCVDAGGDMRQRSEIGENLTVGLEHPEDFTSVVGTVKILNRSLCGSAGNRRAWANYHHIINPQSLESPREFLAVWVLSDTTLLADILTTGLYFVSPELLQKSYKFEYLILKPDYTVEKSEGFNADLFMG